MAKLIREKVFGVSQWGDTPVSVNPVVDPQAPLTDPTNLDFEPQSSRELEAALKSLVQGTRLPPGDVYDIVKKALRKSEEEMKKANRVEEAIRKHVRRVLSEITAGELRSQGIAGVPSSLPDDTQISDILASRLMGGGSVVVPAGVSGAKPKPTRSEEDVETRIKPGEPFKYGREEYEADVKWLQKKLGTKLAEEAVDDISPDDIKKNLMGELKVKYVSLLLRAGGDPGSLGMVDKTAKAAYEKYEAGMKILAAQSDYDERDVNDFANREAHEKAQGYPRISKDDLDIVLSWVAQKKSGVSAADAKRIEEMIESEEPDEAVVKAARDSLKVLLNTSEFKEAFDAMSEEAAEDAYEFYDSAINAVLSRLAANNDIPLNILKEILAKDGEELKKAVFKYFKDKDDRNEKLQLIADFLDILEKEPEEAIPAIVNMTGVDDEVAKIFIESQQEWDDEDDERIDFISSLLNEKWMPQFKEMILQKCLVDPTVKAEALKSLGISEKSFQKYSDAMLDARNIFLKFLDDKKEERQRSAGSSPLPSRLRRRV